MDHELTTRTTVKRTGSKLTLEAEFHLRDARFIGQRVCLDLIVAHPVRSEREPALWE
jgi:hypothetical protein